MIVSFVIYEKSIGKGEHNGFVTRRTNILFVLGKDRSRIVVPR
jgi:hypothetical protein